MLLLSQEADLKSKEAVFCVIRLGLSKPEEQSKQEAKACCLAQL